MDAPMKLKDYLDSLERGGAARLAEAMGISSSYLSQLASGAAAISATRSVEIEKLTDGTVSRKDTHPEDWHEIWPELAEPKTGRCSTDKRTT